MIAEGDEICRLSLFVGVMGRGGDGKERTTPREHLALELASNPTPFKSPRDVVQGRPAISGHPPMRATPANRVYGALIAGKRQS
jgi:hypothetical protein